jgi:glutaryl-CoA dehydrogenase (non-decarboxylating)
MNTDLGYDACPSGSRVRSFLAEQIAPYAAAIDRDESVPEHIIRALASQGYLGAGLDRRWGGGDLAPLEYGYLHHELGRVSASVEGVVNVQNMVSQALVRWGSKDLCRQWLPLLAGGERLGAFAISEPQTGSDAGSISTKALPSGSDYRLRGEKKWITSGQVADILLVLAASENGPAMFLVEARAEGISRKPIEQMLGCRGYMLSSISFDDVTVPRSNLIGGPGFGLSHVAATGLDAGRYSLAWGCVGMAQACLESALSYATNRKQFGIPLADHQLVQRMIARMVVAVRAARALCVEAATARAEKTHSAMMATAIAKYFASTSLTRVAEDAVQLHGAAGCSSEYSVERYLRDSKIMEVIEGTTQMHEIMISAFAAQEQKSRGVLDDSRHGVRL